MLRVLPSCAIARLEAPDADAVLRVMAARLHRCGAVTPGFATAVCARERSFPTGLATVVPAAIPHTEPEHVLRPGLALAALARPVRFGAMGTAAGASVEVELVVMLALRDASSHLRALSRLMGALRDEVAVRSLLASPDDAELERRAAAWLAAGE